uniref:C2H2-type domain-containing protein n=1 Tax=Anas platyrhynchos platyrhynchos TaxID=8840 RepID=A0A493T8U1_ANAPP
VPRALLVLPTWWLCRAVGTLGHFSDAVPLLPAAPRHGMAGEDPPGDGDQGHWVPPVPPSGGAKELGCPPLCPGWCEAGTWGSPRRMGTWERGERLLEPDAASLGAHQGEHLGPAPSHECTACGKVFQHHRNLLTHKKHRGRHRHACAECGCTFCLRGDLLRHRAVHAGEGSYPCALCSRRFRHKRDLHVEERPFVCGRCGRSFSWKESLMIHQRSHAPERSHKCPVCGRSFSRSGNLLPGEPRE